MHKSQIRNPTPHRARRRRRFAPAMTRQALPMTHACTLGGRHTLHAYSLRAACSRHDVMAPFICSHTAPRPVAPPWSLPRVSVCSSLRSGLCVVSHGHLVLGPRLTSSLVVVSSLDERIDSADSPLSTATLNHQNLASLRLVHTRAVSLTATHTNMLGSLHSSRTHPHNIYQLQPSRSTVCVFRALLIIWIQYRYSPYYG